MFNRSAFNRLKFNRSKDHKTLSAELSTSAAIQANERVILTTSAHLIADSDLRQLTYMSAHLSADSNLKASAGLVMPVQIALSAEAELVARASKWQRREIVFNGTWLPGQVIIINHKELTLLLNGQNALRSMKGKFGSFSLGLNELVYTDTAALRTVLAQIIYQQNNV
ncbi:hypothetical protein ACFSTH_08395 [Paenibacillus yanchengensis]|uniref:Uncharacterized protein n=1 Tax=Paenibacillus yanchengensis TaxID=2035833 RepID=A0ABW4YKS7_9BACL